MIKESLAQVWLTVHTLGPQPHPIVTPPVYEHITGIDTVAGKVSHRYLGLQSKSQMDGSKAARPNPWPR